MPRPSQDGAEVQAMRNAWEALRSARVEAQLAYQDALAAVDRVEGTQFLVTVQNAKRAGLAKYTVSRATGVRAWPKIQDWWGDDVTAPVASTVVPVEAVEDHVIADVVLNPITVLTVDGYTLKSLPSDVNGYNDVDVSWVDTSFIARKNVDDVVVWFDGDHELSFTERVDRIPDVIENAVKGNVWIAAHE
jgi:hypothetical protein